MSLNGLFLSFSAFCDLKNTFFSKKNFKNNFFEKFFFPNFYNSCSLNIFEPKIWRRLGTFPSCFYKFCQISIFYSTFNSLSWCLEKELPFVPARFIRTFSVIYEVNCGLLRGKRKFKNIALFPNF